MEKLIKCISSALGGCIGVFLGSTLYRVLDYLAHPMAYAMGSAPWYTSVLVNALISGVVAALLLPALWIVKKRMR